MKVIARYIYDGRDFGAHCYKWDAANNRLTGWGLPQPAEAKLDHRLMNGEGAGWMAYDGGYYEITTIEESE